MDIFLLVDDNIQIDNISSVQCSINTKEIFLSAVIPDYFKMQFLLGYEGKSLKLYQNNNYLFSLTIESVSYYEGANKNSMIITARKTVDYSARVGNNFEIDNITRFVISDKFGDTKKDLNFLNKEIKFFPNDILSYKGIDTIIENVSYFLSFDNQKVVVRGR